MGYLESWTQHLYLAPRHMCRCRISAAAGLAWFCSTKLHVSVQLQGHLGNKSSMPGCQVRDVPSLSSSGWLSWKESASSWYLEHNHGNKADPDEPCRTELKLQTALFNVLLSRLDRDRVSTNRNMPRHAVLRGWLWAADRQNRISQGIYRRNVNALHAYSKLQDKLELCSLL